MHTTSYSLTPRLLALLAASSERLGEIRAAHLHFPSPLLRRAHRVSVIHATLALEDNPLAPHDVALLLGNEVPKPADTAQQEAMNTIRLYDLLPGLDPYSANDLRQAHGELMRGLALDPGQYRTGPLELMMGDRPGTRRVEAGNISSQVEQLLHFAENDGSPLLVTSCVLHYGLVRLRPFTAGNGRIARFWQKLALMEQWPVFSFLPLESFINRNRAGYYAALDRSEDLDDCAPFITYMMERIDEALHELLQRERPVLSGQQRLSAFLAARERGRFSRKDYRLMFPELSTATTSRDLALGVQNGKLERQGTGRMAWYRPCPTHS